MLSKQEIINEICYNVTVLYHKRRVQKYGLDDLQIADLKAFKKALEVLGYKD